MSETDLELVAKWLRSLPRDEWNPSAVADAIDRGDWKPKPKPINTVHSFLEAISLRVQCLEGRMKDSNRDAYRERILELEGLADQVRESLPIPW